jgi:hypothetical protein
MIISSGLVLIWNLRLFFDYLDYLSRRNSNITKIIKEVCEITITPILSFPHKEGRDYMEQSCLHSLLVDVDILCFRKKVRKDCPSLQKK